MTFTVGSLLALPSARTHSLTPGVGEERPITWAHACELPDPWHWVAPDVLVMTTGLALPVGAQEQLAYVRGLHRGGIAALTIDGALARGTMHRDALGEAARLGFPVLQTAPEVPFMRISMAIAEVATRRSEWFHGSLLLGELCEVSMPARPAGHLIAAYGISSPFVIAAAQDEDPQAVLDAAQTAFAVERVPALAAIAEGQVLILGSASARVDEVLGSLTRAPTRVGVSAHFAELEALPVALRQARSALIRNHEPGRVMRFEEHETSSLFLPNDPDQLRRIARQVLGPLQTYDGQRGTELTHTLRVFLEENRSWVRAAERLFVHRQTLVARVSRIEKIIGRDLSSTEDTVECWLAVQAAIGCGDLDARDFPSPSHPPDPESP